MHDKRLKINFPRFAIGSELFKRRGAVTFFDKCQKRCNRKSSRTPVLISYLSRINRIENSSCSVCGHTTQNTSHLILHCPATDSLRRLLFGDFLSPLAQTLGSCPTSGAPWSSAMPISLRRGCITTTTTTTVFATMTGIYHFVNNMSRRTTEVIEKVINILSQRTGKYVITGIRMSKLKIKYICVLMKDDMESLSSRFVDSTLEEKVLSA